jgi:hypothetical protein
MLEVDGWNLMRASYFHPRVQNLAYLLGLPEDFTCWHTGPAFRFLGEDLPMLLITDRARWTGDESYSTMEAERELMANWNKGP